jgi:hypothetical protein
VGGGSGLGHGGDDRYAVRSPPGVPREPAGAGSGPSVRVARTTVPSPST